MSCAESAFGPPGVRKDIMQAFTINADNNITVFASVKEVEGNGADTETFSTTQELAALVAKWPGARLVETWNSLPGVEPVQRFTSRQVAAMRIWKAIQHLEPSGGAHSRQVAPKPGSARKKADRGTRPAVRENSMTAQVIGLLQKRGGASLKTIMRATGWQAHSVRGFISGHLGKKMGLIVRSFRRDKERVYELNG
jgi:hypothetical protein